MLIKRRGEKFTLFITYPRFCFNPLPPLLKKFRYTSVSKGNNCRSFFIKKVLTTTMKLIPLITFIRHFWSTYLSICFCFLKTNSYSEKKILTVNAFASKEESDSHFSLHRIEKKPHNKTTTDFVLLVSFRKKWVVICEGALTQSLGLFRLEDPMCMWMKQWVHLEKDKAEDLRYTSVI